MIISLLLRIELGTMSTSYLGIGTTAFLGTWLALQLLTAYPDRPLEASKGRWGAWDTSTMRLV